MIYLGTEYGGWHIEESSLNNDSVILSAGLGDDISFDLALIEKYGMTVHGFDPTPKSVAWIKRQSLPERFILHEYGISGIDGNVIFYPPENEAYVSYSETKKTVGKSTISLPVKKMTTIMNELGLSHIDVLKMDIEGSEYNVINDMLECRSFPTQILVEFHDVSVDADYINKLRPFYNISKVNNRDFSFMLK
jgi:FkbM family methyltransferase